MAGQPLVTVREVWLDGPQPPIGMQFCTLCATVYKAAALEAGKELISQAATGQGPDRLSLADLLKGTVVREPEPAVGYGIAAPLGGALVPLCWSHLGAVKFTGLATGDAALGSQLAQGRR